MIRYVFNDGMYQVNYETNGISKPHLTLSNFGLFAKEEIKKHKENYGK